MLRCAWCHADLDQPVACPGCGTALHRDCWSLTAACPTLGCGDRGAPGRPPPAPRRPPRRVALAFVGASCLGVCFLITRGGLLWDAVTHASEAYELVFTQDGQHLVARCQSGIRVADARTGEWVRYCELAGDDEGLAVSPDGRLVATGRRLWRIEQLYGAPVAPIAALPGRVAAFSPDGGAIACLGESGRVLLTDLEGRVTRSLDPGAPSDEVGWLWYHDPQAGFSADGARLVCRTPGGARVWDARAGAVLLELRGLEPLRALRLSRDGTVLAGVTRGRLVHWSVPGGLEVASQVLVESGSPYGHGDFAIAPDLETCAWTSAGGRGDLRASFGFITLGRLGSSARQRRITGSWTRTMTFSPDGALLAIGRYGNRVQVWRVGR